MINGKNIIGFEYSNEGSETFKAVNPALVTEIDGDFYSATEPEVARAVSKAVIAFDTYASLSGEKKANFLDQIGAEILDLGDELVQRAVQESGLPEARIVGERGRTVGQLNNFANLLREGSWVEASIDTAIPDRSPIPKPDLRKMLIPIGPVVVFGASNFPLAFSTAGGDTASVLAGGNPVIVKAHNSHPGTSELVAEAIYKAAEKTGMPDGVFSHLQDKGYSVAQQLVTAEGVKAVAFTGSLRGGKALFELSARRKVPIPVFAEMGSINPVIILPGALEKSGDLATQYAGSITLGSGQFCTNPGLLVSVASDSLENFKTQLGNEIEKIVPTTMLNEGIYAHYQSLKENTIEQAGVKVLSKSSHNPGNTSGTPLVATVSGKDFISNPSLHEEVFGPFSLLVECSDQDQLERVASLIEGQLTITLMGTENDLINNKAVIKKLIHKTGRILFNGVPTGVEVCPSMQHGGPFPASSDSRFTSVGTGAIKRFVRPMSYQNWPNDLLPLELQDKNPLGIWRLKDNNWNNSTE